MVPVYRSPRRRAAAEAAETARARGPQRKSLGLESGTPQPAGTCVRGAIACRTHHEDAAHRVGPAGLRPGRGRSRSRARRGRIEQRCLHVPRVVGSDREHGISGIGRRAAGRRTDCRRGATARAGDRTGADRPAGRRRYAAGRRRDGAGLGGPLGRPVHGRAAAPGRRRRRHCQRPRRDAADARQPERQRADGGAAPRSRGGSERGPAGGRDRADDGRTFGQRRRAATPDRGRSRRRRNDPRRAYGPDVGGRGTPRAGGEPPRRDRGGPASAHRRAHPAPRGPSCARPRC